VIPVSASDQPFFSIIVPTRDRPERLVACLQSLLRLDYPPHRFEVVVVDDGSETPLDDVLAPFCGRLDFTLIRQANSGPALARNTGGARARGAFLAFLDDDCAPASDWLQRLAVRCTQNPRSAIGGHTLNALPANLYSTASQMLIDYLYTYHNNDRATFFTSNNLAVPAEQFHSIGGFDASFPIAAAEDRELCNRWLEQGYEMVYDPEIKIHHRHSLTLRLFLRQQFKYGRGAFRFHQKRLQRTGRRIKVEPASFYLNMFRYPLPRTKSSRALWLAMLLTLSQLANATGFLWESLRQD
jgi:glycosyltransferase involved in cell wall biosynthesis